MPARIPDETIEAILQSRRLGRAELCAEQVDRWLKKLVTWYTADKHLQEDLAQECQLYFLETVYRWIEQREPKSVRASLEILMNRRILSMLRNNRVRSGVKKERMNVKTEELSDFTGVYTRETIERNSRPRQKAILDLFMKGYSTTDVQHILGFDRKTIQNVRATMVV
ncbi:MAG: hypothetical protein MUC88_20820 [Planctomycetes bacterium]|nr:hypothetical protein [Planctomycetota bacterium]